MWDTIGIIGMLLVFPVSVIVLIFTIVSKIRGRDKTFKPFVNTIFTGLYMSISAIILDNVKEDILLKATVASLIYWLIIKKINQNRVKKKSSDMWEPIDFDIELEDMVEDWRSYETEEQRIKRKKHNLKMQRKADALTIKEGYMTYYGGGKIDKAGEIKIQVTSEGMYYDKFFIKKDNIQDVILDIDTHIISHLDKRLTVTRMLLFGPFALAMPKKKEKTREQKDLYLAIDYLDNGEKYTLILGGDNASEIQYALRVMKNPPEEPNY